MIDFYPRINGWDNLTGIQYGAGVEYQLNPHVGFALNYVRMDWDEDTDVVGTRIPDWDNHIIRFRTQITF